MISKPVSDQPLSTSPRLRAGIEAESQMGFYLHRAFAQDQSVYVINDLRLVDPKQPENSGAPGVCQIDHLVIHRYGMFIIESKSVTDAVTIRSDGSGGDEWTRRFKGREQGFPSPIQQAKRQGQLLKTFLEGHKQELLGFVSPGARRITKLIKGTDQRGFRNMPIQVMVAISDNGKIQRIDAWNEPTEPFPTFVTKADLVPDKIREQLKLHTHAAGLFNEDNGNYGVWLMKPEEVGVVAEFLVGEHGPKSEKAVAKAHVSANESVPTEVVCSQCQSAQLSAYWGQKSYCWKCAECGKSTPMPQVCSIYGAVGVNGQGVRIKKQGPKCFRWCDLCAIDECVWTQR